MQLTPGRLGLSLLGLAAVALAVLGYLLFGLGAPEPTGVPLDLTREGAVLRTATVYYLAADTLALVVEERQVLDHGSRRALIAELVTHLTEGGPGRRPPLPPGTRLLHYFETPDGEMVLDFTAALETAGGESLREDQLRLTALARTLAENLGQEGTLRILVHGRPLVHWGRHLRLDAVLDLEAWS